MRLSRLLSCACLAVAGVALGACVPRQAPPTPQPAPPPPPPVPAPPPPSPPSPSAASWEDAPLAVGDWSYRTQGETAEASFTSAGQALLTVRCEGPGSVALLRPGGGAAAAAITVTTTFGERTLAATADGSGLSARLNAGDLLLDQIAFSRGRILVRAGGDALIVPAWPEVARVVEDCRR